MSDEARDAHLQWLDDCARAQVVDYETWLEGRVAQLEAEIDVLIAALKLALETTNSLMKDVY